MSGKRLRKDKVAPVGEIKCSAHKKDGTPCKNPPMNGTNVCRVHGGSAPQTRRKAAERIAAAADPAAKVMVDLLKSAKEEMRAKAAADLMDRNALGTKQEISIDVPAYLRNVDGLFVDYDDVVDADVVEDEAIEEDSYKSEDHPMERRFPEGERLTIPRDPDAPPTYDKPTP